MKNAREAQSQMGFAGVFGYLSSDFRKMQSFKQISRILGNQPKFQYKYEPKNGKIITRGFEKDATRWYYALSQTRGKR